MRAAIAPSALAVGIVAAHGASVFMGREEILGRFAFRPTDWARWLVDPAATPQSGWATPFSYALAHVDWAHALFNAVAILAMGAIVTRATGVVRWAGLCLAGAFAGAFGEVMAALFASANAPETALVGGSAVVAALAGTVVWIIAAGAVPDPCERRRAEFAALAGAAAAFLFLLVTPTAGASDAPTSWRAHVAGFLAGFALARPLVQGRRARVAASAHGEVAPAAASPLAAQAEATHPSSRA